MLDNLPDITFVEKDAKLIESEIINAYESLAGRTLAPGDPVRLFLLSIASIIIQQRALIDFSAKQNLLAYSIGDYLDHIGALLGVKRLSAKPATTTIRFALSEVRQDVIAIPKGTRIRAESSEIVFATTAYAEIPAGQLSIDIPAECMAVGEVGNGYLPGQIKRLVDPIPWVQSVVNITESSGGSNVETDDNFRDRIRIAPESFSVAGPSGAYNFWARTAHQDITDVAVISPSPGVVEIYVLLKNGGIPSQEILDVVLETVSDEKIRPLTDQVFALAPTVIEYDLDVTWWLANDRAVEASQISAAANKAVNDWTSWQKSALGRDINPSVLISKMIAAGAKRVDVISPSFTVLAPSEVAIARSVSVTFGGMEDA